MQFAGRLLFVLGNLAAPAIWAYQCTAWLWSRAWYPLPFSRFAADWLPSGLSRWLAEPESWQGLAVVCNWLMDANAGVTTIVLTWTLATAYNVIAGLLSAFFD